MQAVRAPAPAARRACKFLHPRPALPRCSSFRPTWRPVDAEPNRLNDQILVRYYEREWRDIAQ